MLGWAWSTKRCPAEDAMRIAADMVLAMPMPQVKEFIVMEVANFVPAFAPWWAFGSIPVAKGDSSIVRLKRRDWLLLCHGRAFTGA